MVIAKGRVLFSDEENLAGHSRGREEGRTQSFTERETTTPGFETRPRCGRSSTREGGRRRDYAEIASVFAVRVSVDLAVDLLVDSCDP
jgi:hypothetical protein